MRGQAHGHRHRANRRKIPAGPGQRTEKSGAACDDWGGPAAAANPGGMMFALSDLAAVISALASLIAALLGGIAAILAVKMRRDISIIEKSTNSIKDELVSATKHQYFAEGMIQGRKEEEERTK